MTREQAVKIYRTFGFMRAEPDMRARLPSCRVDMIIDECAEDMIDGLIALGILIVDQPKPAEPVDLNGPGMLGG